MCEASDCAKWPSFNAFGEKKARFCGAHKEDGMVDVMNKRWCLEDGCSKRPAFNVEGEKPEYCSMHKLEGMVDVKNTKKVY